ncbi:MAG TPA: HAD family phosphatase [Microbacteriaceae bacterium]|nr:HAD family phosphatase [Microbacteriaceae bacterium]
MTGLQAVLWDMDGTLVDTEPYWIAAETALIEAYGGTWTHQDALQLVGQGLWASAEIIRAAGVPLSADEIVYGLTSEVRALLRERGIPWQPGARELLEELREAGVPTALVTMSLREMALEVAENVGFTAFDVVIAGDDVARPKPHPEPYLVALEALGRSAQGSVGIEDSRTGVRSARSAGLATIGVPHMISLDDSDAHVVWPSLAGRGIVDLHQLIQEVHS